MIEIVLHSIEGGFSQTGSCVLQLATADGQSCIPVVIGPHEANSLLVAKNGVASQRPKTHQLLKAVMDTFGLAVESVSIDRVEEGIFFATLHVSDGFNSKAIDSRATDAVTLALLAGAPMYASEQVVEECGVPLPTPAMQQEASIESLKEELHRCEANEEYERAAEIQALLEQMER
ncbi:MAG: bifunctional nuclease family protein [Bacteroidales bacterium]|nr:bifunctional nuclease family protein [Bacteroidales bacterium]